MEHLAEEYLNLKNKIIDVAGTNIHLDRIKDIFQHDINSRRDLARVYNLSDVINLLDARDIINPCNIAALQCLGEVLGNSQIVDMLRAYEKLNLDDPDYICTCGTQCTYIPKLEMPPEINNVSPASGNGDTPDTSLEEALDAVSRRIGENWCTLARELPGTPIREYQIDLVRRKFPRDFQKQAYKIFQIWCEMNKGNVTLEMFDKALNKRLCRRKGIGPHLKEPLIDIESYGA